MSVVNGKGNSSERQKRSAYPYATFQKAREIAQAVKDLGGSNADVQKSVVAHRLGVEESSPGLSQNIVSAKLFGLIEGHGSYRLTDLAKRYFFPTDDQERQQALLEMVSLPPVFGALIDRFDGTRLPKGDVLVNILHRDFNVSPSWRARVAALFLGSMREAQIIDASGCLRYRAQLYAGGVETGTPPISREPPVGKLADDHTSRTPAAPQFGRQRAQDTVLICVGQDDSVRLDTNGELSVIAWEKLNRIVQAIRPSSGDHSSGHPTQEEA